MIWAMANWHALYCEPQRELFARDRLIENGVEVFCPFESVVKRRAIPGRPGQFRSYKVNVGVYAPYIFARTDEFMLVDRLPGILSIVGVRGKPLNVPDHVIDKLKLVADEKGMIDKDLSKPSFWFEGKIGDEFEFGGGAFAGLIGTITSLDKLDDSGEVRAWVKMLARELDVVVGISSIGRLTTVKNDPGAVGDDCRATERRRPKVYYR